MKLISLHKGLYQYICAELVTKRTLSEYVTFFIKTARKYFSVLVDEYKSVFYYLDSDYRKQVKEHEKYTQAQKVARMALKWLQYIDIELEQKNLNRTEKRAFWNDFISKKQIRKEVFERLMKSL